MTDNKDSDDYIDWLETAIINEHLDYFEYSDFKNIKQIGKGSFGNVSCANWKDSDYVFVLKSFKNQKSTLKEVVNELKLHRKVHFHENIIKMLGITRNKIQQMNVYTLVLEYADSGTLKTYLDKHFNDLEWEDKLRLASQLADAILYLHGRDIIHCDLHANNILVHRKNIRLSDFGLSKKIAESSYTSEIFGVIPYMDPKSFNNRNYELNKKSDVYSVGVIMWQISSGRQPFENVKYDGKLTLAIQEGERENIIGDTPIEYSNSFTKCWKYEPNERPDINEVVSTLKSMRNYVPIDNIIEEAENNLISDGQTKDLNSDLILESKCEYTQYQKVEENGNKISQYNLGNIYEHESGFEKDEINEFEFYKKPAEQDNNDNAQIRFFLENGKGIEKDLEKDKGKSQVKSPVNKNGTRTVGESKVAVAATVEVAESVATIGSSLENAKAVLEVVGTVGEAVKPFLPLIPVFTTVTGEIIKIYENAEYNKKLCNALMDRVEEANYAIKALERRKILCFQDFIRLVDVLKKIKVFVKDISQLQGYKKFLSSGSGSIKDIYNSLIEEFDTVMKDLNISITIANEEQRMIDQQDLMKDIVEMSMRLEKIKSDITDNNQVNTILQEVRLIQDQLDHFTDIKRTKIKPYELMHSSSIINTSPILIPNNSIDGFKVTAADSCVNENGIRTESFIPLITVITTVISECSKIYEDAEYNKSICNALMDRVQVADNAIKILNIRIQDNEKTFLSKKFHKAFVKFTNVMKKIKEFMKGISQIQGFKKFIHISSIKDRFNDLVKEFETVMKDLNFFMTIDNEEQRIIVQQHLYEDIIEMSKSLDIIEGGIIAGDNQINTVLQEIIIIKNKLDVPGTIRAHELVDLLGGKATDRRGNKEPYIIKKYYKTSIEVACLPITIPEDNSMEAQKIQAQLAILGKLKDSPNILKFYGLSHVDDNLIMVFEWAECGNLCEVYNKYDVSWTVKVSIALEICRGITYLHSCSILHHDIRCANIMITSHLTPKLTNFKYSRLENDTTTNITNLTEVVHWLAPEKLRNVNGQQYNTKCEIFSFGMLLWELAFEKIPYENWDMNKIREHVLSNKREKISFGKESPTIQKLQQNYAKIIISAWQDDPQIRASLQQISLDLDAMHTEFCSSLLVIKPDKSMNDNGSKTAAAAATSVSISDDGREG